MTPERLRDLYGQPKPRSAAKVITTFDKHCRDFIEHSSFLVLATSDGTNLDVSPKGDPAGFVKVDSDTTVLIPDRLGNNRLDGLMNILAHPNVALIFMIPTIVETLRVNGVAEILDDPSLCEQFQIKGRSPKTVLRVTAKEIYTHCGKAPMRGGLWDQESWPKERPIATLYEMLRDHTKLSVESTGQAAVDEYYKKTIY